MRARISGVTSYLPELVRSSTQVEQKIAQSGPYGPRAGVLAAVTGIHSRRVAPDDWQASDLAVAAAGKLLAQQGVGAADVDLLIFSSASQDMVEPATAHIVAAKLGARCPVFDVKNACNSVLNAIQVAEALIGSGQYRRVLVCTGEVPSRAIRWSVRDRAQFIESAPGYTLSDAGAALLLEPHESRGIFHREFTADSASWAVGTLPGGGTAHPRDADFSYFRMDGGLLRRAFESLGVQILFDALAAHELTWADFAMVAVHQVTVPFLEVFLQASGVPRELLVPVLADCGNLASAALPFQLAAALEQGRAGPGDRVALVGLAGGISMGVVFMDI